MAYTPLRDVPTKVANTQPFQGNSMSGEFYFGGVPHQISAGMGDEAPPIGSIYVVWSYTTPIAWLDHVGRAHRVRRKFSVTTSKHQGKLYTLDDLTAEERDRYIRITHIIKEHPFD